MTTLALPTSKTLWLIQWGTYPFLLIFTLTLLFLDLNDQQPGRLAAVITGGNALMLLLLERLHPFQQRWQMNRSTFKTDLLFILVNAPTIGVTNWALTWVVLHYAPGGDLLSSWSLIPQVIAGLLIFQFFQYWLHRLQHELNGPGGRFLWRMHRAHHSLDRVYLLMHVRAHPLDTLLVRALYILPLGWLGLSPEALYVISAFVGLQGLVSHLNIDLRTGYLNYLLVGTELHRYHHSADMEEAKNYGNTLPIFDILFGTFVYNPGQTARELGLPTHDDGPSANRLWQQVRYPFQRG